MKLRDSKDRRTRSAPPQPKPGRIDMTARADRIFEMLNRHGPLPSTYLFELTRGVARNKIWFLKTLTKLYNGVTTRGEHVNYLIKPAFQWPPDDFGTLPVIYDVNPLAQLRLEERGIPIVKRSGGDIHDFMSACCMASLQIFLESQRYEYKDLTALISHKNYPGHENPLSIPVAGVTIKPDHLFATQNGKLTLYAVEIDRKTETIEDKVAHSSYGRKLKIYTQALNDKTFNKHVGLHMGVETKVLTITTSKKHMENMQAYARSIKAPNHFLFSYVEGYFSKPWRMPPLLLFKWQDVNGKEVML